MLWVYKQHPFCVYPLVPKCPINITPLVCLILRSLRPLHFTHLTIVPKKDMEVWVRLYHGQGLTNPKLLAVLRNHFDTKKYGLRFMTCFASWCAIHWGMQVNKTEGVAKGVGAQELLGTGTHNCNGVWTNSTNAEEVSHRWC